MASTVQCERQCGHKGSTREMVWSRGAHDLYMITANIWSSPGLSQAEVFSKVETKKDHVNSKSHTKRPIALKRAGLKHKLIIRRLTRLFAQNAVQ